MAVDQQTIEVDPQFFEELSKLEKDVRSSGDPKAELRHLKKIQMWGRICSFFGFATAAIWCNPLSALLISQGKLVRWAIIAHHVLHRAYDNLPGVPLALSSKGFARSWRRYFQWLDWIDPLAWEKEHNVLHHYRLGERFDPDIFEDNVEIVRRWHAPKLIKGILLVLGASQWKWFYYAPSTIKQLFSPKKSGAMSENHDRLVLGDSTYNPRTAAGRKLWLSSYLPYISLNFILTPLIFGLFSKDAAWNVFFVLVMAEIFTNLHSFLVIVPNHTGGDVFRFQGAPKNRQEFYLRQIMGSVNYRCGGDLNDFLHAWLNYQIEHHVWPDMTLLQYRRIQKPLQELCLRYQVPYVQESVWRRLVKLWRVYACDQAMKSAPIMVAREN